MRSRHFFFAWRRNATASSLVESVMTERNVGLLLLLLVSLGCAGSEAATDGETAAGRLAVVRGDLTSHVLLTGELEAERAESLMVPNANIWPVQIRWLAEDGVEVAQGEKLVEFDNSQLTANLEEMVASKIEAEKALASLRARAAGEESQAAFDLEMKRAAADKARLEAEVPDGVLAEVELEKRRLDLKRAELELAEAEAKLESTRRAKEAEIEVQRLALEKTRARLTRSQKRLEILTLTAARDGILTLANHRREERPVRVGDSVFPGWPVGRLPDLESMIVAARLFDVDDGRLAAGTPIVATLDAFPDLEFAGRVREIDQIADQADAESLRRFFRVKIDLERVDLERMRPGMSVKVVAEQQHRGVLLVPRRCLAWGPATAGDGEAPAGGEGPASGARARLADGSWAPVVLGPCDASACIVSEGLEESTRLARAREGRG